MGTLLGMLGIAETDLSYMSRLGQQVIYDTINDYLVMHNAELAAAEAALVERTVIEYAFRYKLPGSGYMERQGGQAQAASTKLTGSWDVAFPLEDFGQNLLSDDVTMVYMTPTELEMHIDGIRQRDINTRRREILQALFTNTTRTFADERGGTLTIQPLANGDAVVYPPVRGSATEATRDRYVVTGYTAASIDATNNPVRSARTTLEADFGAPAGFGNVVSFYNSAQMAKLEALAGFDPIEDMNIQSGTNTDIPINLPSVPGTLRGRAYGVWIAEWEWIPANYALSVHLDAARPLMRRIDPPAQLAALGLQNGLTLKATDKNSPLETSKYRNRYGYGVGNRLNALVQQFKAPGSYDIPSVG